MIYMKSVNGLHIVECEWNDLTNVDEITYQAAKKIEALSAGLSPQQFTEAISIAMSFVNRGSTLLTQSVPLSGTQG